MTRRISLNDGKDYLVWRDGSGDTVEIYDIAVNSERRTGIGRRLVEELFRGLGHEERLVWAITRAENQIAQLFYEALGFRVVGVLRAFYDLEAGGVDAIMYGRSNKGPL